MAKNKNIKKHNKLHQRKKILQHEVRKDILRNNAHKKHIKHLVKPISQPSFLQKIFSKLEEIKLAWNLSPKHTNKQVEKMQHKIEELTKSIK
jgi:hypothetical protein